VDISIIVYYNYNIAVIIIIEYKYLLAFAGEKHFEHLRRQQACS